MYTNSTAKLMNIIATPIEVSAAATQEAALENQVGIMTPDALMSYCSSRLRDIDSEMSRHFTKQQGFRNAAADLNQLQSDLDSFAKDTVDYGDGQKMAINGGAREAQIDREFQKTLAEMPPGQDRTNLQAQYDKFKASMNDHAFSVDEAQNMSQALGNVSKDIGATAELDMIQLQSLMSQRQTAVQMCTNLVSALGETSKAIAQKVGA